ncbi:MAG: pilus assembly protein PilM [Synergistaceae bacterium]|nr:pilus assembly protein PilM [Synergistaceae bacterium]
MAFLKLKLKRKCKASLFLDGNKFQYLSLSGGFGNYTIADMISEQISLKHNNENSPQLNTKEGLNECFSILSSRVAEKETPLFISLPISDSLLRIVDLPGITIEEAKLAFRYEFENYFPFPLDEGIFDIAMIDYPLIDQASEKRFMVVATRLSLIDNIMTAAANNGFIVSGIIPSQISIEKAMDSIPNLNEMAVYIYAGRLRSVMILSWKGNGVFYRSISMGFDQALEHFETAKDTEEKHDFIDDNSQTIDFVKEIRFSMQFALSQIRGFNPQAVYLSGPGANLSMLTLLTETLAIEDISIIDLFNIHTISVNNRDITENWDIPLGSVLR